VLLHRPHSRCRFSDSWHRSRRQRHPQLPPSSPKWRCHLRCDRHTVIGFHRHETPRHSSFHRQYRGDWLAAFDASALAEVCGAVIWYWGRLTESLETEKWRVRKSFCLSSCAVCDRDECGLLYPIAIKHGLAPADGGEEFIVLDLTHVLFLATEAPSLGTFGKWVRALV
jgi:hypothetical protein